MLRKNKGNAFGMSKIVLFGVGGGAIIVVVGIVIFIMMKKKPTPTPPSTFTNVEVPKV